MRLIESGQTQTEVAEKPGVSLSYVNRITNGWEWIVNKTFVRTRDELGYDVKLFRDKEDYELEWAIQYLENEADRELFRKLPLRGNHKKQREECR